MHDNIGDVQKSLGEGVDGLNELTDPFTDAYEQIGEIFSNTSEDIDKYGKMGVKIVFTVLMVINIALAVLLLLICLFSGKSCTSCCFCRCIFKLCTHVLWNILALMMILSFILGSLISLVGRIGGDAMSLVSFIVSKDNFNDNENALLVNELGDAKKYLERCIQGDGDIAQELDLGNSLNSFNQINNVQENITTFIHNFTLVKTNLITYNIISTLLRKQLRYEDPITMIHIDGIRADHPPIVFSQVLDKINEIIGTNRGWSTEEVNSLPCQSSSLSSSQKYYPRACHPIDETSYSSIAGYNDYANLIKDMQIMVDYANNDISPPTTTYAGPKVKDVIESLKGNYINYLDKYLEVLGFFNETIQEITGLIREYIGNDNNSFAFLNGKFIGTNLKIILKYLKHSLGGDFYTVVICLVVVGFSLILSISSTILLIVIINISLKENMDAEKMLNNANTAVAGFSEFQSNYVSPGPKY